MLWGVRPRLRPPVRANGAMELRQLMKIGFEDHGLASIYSNIVETNKVSLAVTMEAGLRVVGRRRAAHVVDDVCLDRIILDLLADEYLEQEAQLERYLAEDSGETGADKLVLTDPTRRYERDLPFFSSFGSAANAADPLNDLSVPALAGE